ncbi:MAG: hypothetical protein H7325_09825 [Pedobacter sp.]|nr:hypothetical protein [Pedobacter sp.]
MKVEDWKTQVKTSLVAEGIYLTEIEDSEFCLLAIETAKIIIHLIDIPNKFSLQEVIDLANREQFRSQKFVQLWEDVWERKKELVVDRLRSFCGLSRRVHGRKTKFERISKPLAETFLNENHLQGYASSRFKYGLVLAGELLAVITFSATRNMDYGEEYRSIELIRFAIKRGFSVSGGLSKLLIGHHRLHPTTDIMTYIDLDWGTGLAFKQLGFKQVDVVAPLFFKLGSDFERHKTTQPLGDVNGLVFNSGSAKMILNFEDGCV